MFKALVEFIQGGQYDDRPNYDFVFVFNMGIGEKIIRVWGPYPLTDIKVSSEGDWIETLSGHRFHDGEGVVGWFYWIKDTPIDTGALSRILIPKIRG